MLKYTLREAVEFYRHERQGSAKGMKPKDKTILAFSLNGDYSETKPKQIYEIANAIRFMFQIAPPRAQSSRQFYFTLEKEEANNILRWLGYADTLTRDDIRIATIMAFGENHLKFSNMYHVPFFIYSKLMTKKFGNDVGKLIMSFVNFDTPGDDAICPKCYKYYKKSILDNHIKNCKKEYRWPPYMRHMKLDNRWGYREHQLFK